MNMIRFAARLLIASALAVPAAHAQTPQPYVTVPSIAALKAMTNRPPVVEVVDANPGIFNLSQGACSAADDVFQVQPTSGSTVCYTRMATVYAIGKDPNLSSSLATATGASAARTLAEHFADERYVSDFEAVCDGVADDTASIQAALNAGTGVVRLTAGQNCRVTSTIVVGGGRTLDMGNFIPGNPVTSSARITCDAGVSPCLQLGTNSSNITSALRNATITRAGGAPSSSTVGIEILDGYNVNLTNVISDNHGVCYLATSHPLVGAGLGIRVINGFSSRCVDAHIVNHGYAEFRWIGGRIGQNGASDYASNTMVRMQGGETGTAGGPNGVTFDSVQFNVGGTVCSTHFWEFVNNTASGGPGQTGYILQNSHVEGICPAGAVYYSDATWTSVDGFKITNTTYNNPTTPFFALNAATKPFNWDLVANVYYTSTFNLAPTNGFTAFNMVGGYVSGTMDLTGTTGSTASIHGLSHGGAYTLQGNWGAYSSFGEKYVSGSLTNNATGNVVIVNAQGDMIFDTAQERLFGSNVPLTGIGGLVPRTQINGSGVGSWFSVGRQSPDSSSGNIQLYKTRSATVSGHTIVQSGDLLGSVVFAGDDGTAYIPGAEIRASVSGTPGTNDMPGQLSFYTTPDGTAVQTEKLRIGASILGLVPFATTTINATTAYQANGTPGLSATKTVRDAAGTGTCTLIFTFGLLTGGTC